MKKICKLQQKVSQFKKHMVYYSDIRNGTEKVRLKPTIHTSFKHALR